MNSTTCQSVTKKFKSSKLEQLAHNQEVRVDIDSCHRYDFLEMSPKQLALVSEDEEPSPESY